MSPDDWATYLIWRPEFARAIDEGLYPLSWVDNLVASGGAHFIHADNCAAIYEVRTYPSGAQDIHGLVAAGELSGIVDGLIPAITAHGRLLGCVGFIIESREGWQKALKPLGFEPHQVSVRAAI